MPYIPLSALFFIVVLSIIAIAACDTSLDHFRHKILKGNTADAQTRAYMIFTETKMTLELFFGAEERKKAQHPGIFSFSGDLEIRDGAFIVSSSIMYNATGVDRDESIQLQYKASSALQPIRFTVDKFSDSLYTRIALEVSQGLYTIFDVAWQVAPSTRGAMQLNKMHKKATQVYGYYESHKATYLKPSPFSPFVYYDTIVVSEQGYFMTDAGVRSTNETLAPNFGSMLTVTGELVVNLLDDDVYQLHVSPVVEITGSSSRGYSTERVVMDRYAQFSEDGQKMLIFVLQDGERVAEAEFFRQK